jgi:hypothetical protein
MVNTPFVEISPTVVWKEEVVYYGHLSIVRSVTCIRRHSSTMLFLRVCPPTCAVTSGSSQAHSASTANSQKQPPDVYSPA